MESLARKVQDKIVETFSNALLDKFNYRERDIDQLEEKLVGEQKSGGESETGSSTSEQHERKLEETRATCVQQEHRHYITNYCEIDDNESGKNDQCLGPGDDYVAPMIDRESDEENRDIGNYSFRGIQTNFLRPAPAEEAHGDTVDNNSKKKEAQEEKGEGEEPFSRSTLLELYIQYQDCVKKEEMKMKHLDDNISVRRNIEHCINLLSLIQNVEDEFAKKIKKGELSRSDVISNIRRGMNKNLVKEGRIEKKNNDNGSAYLNKKYQKLYIANTLLENDFDQLREEYESLKRDYEELIKAPQSTSNDAIMSMTAFKGMGRRIGKKLTKSNLSK